MGERERRLDEVRARRTPLENHLIDELRAGKIGRREFIRRGAVVGMSVPMLGFIASACGVTQRGPRAGRPAADRQARVRRDDPRRRAAAGRRAGPGDRQRPGRARHARPVGRVPGLVGPRAQAAPRLAESWTPSEDGQVWRFKLRQGVTFHDGAPLTAEDVAATFNRLADPDVGSNALSVFNGVLSKGGAKAADPTTVEFELDAPNGNFPFLVSSDNYNAIILPASYEGDWEKSFIGTGPWKLEEYRPGSGVSYERNEEYWDPQRRTVADRSEFRFYGDEQASVFGLLGNEVDVLLQFSVAGGKALLTDPDIRTLELEASAHRQIHLRNDVEPFQDKRVRQAMALLVNRTRARRRPARHQVRHRQRQPVRPRLPVDRRRPAAPARRAQGQGAARRRGQGGRLHGGLEHVGRVRDARPGAAAAAGRARGRDPDRPHDHRRRHVLRRGDVRQLAVAGLDDGDHRVRPPRRAQRAARRAAAVQGHVERRALQERPLRRARKGLHGGGRPRRAADARRSRSRSCCSTRARSCSPTSTTTSRGRGTRSPTSRSPRWATSISAAPGWWPSHGTVHRQTGRPQPDHALPAVRDRVRRLPGPAGRRRAQHPRPVRRPAVRRRAQRGARHQPLAHRPVPRLDRGPADVRHGRLAHARAAGLGRARGGARQLAEARRPGLHPRDPAVDPRRRLRRAQRGQQARPVHLARGPVRDRDPGLRLGRAADPGLQPAPRDLPRDRDGAARAPGSSPRSST